MNNRNAYAEARPRRAAREANADAIHTTLPMEDLIGMFESEIRTIIAYDSFEYANARTATHIFRGKLMLHKCDYRISIAGLDLGHVTFTRATPFADAEIDQIEGALGALTIHLNNALDYQAGLGEQELTSLRADNEYAALD